MLFRSVARHFGTARDISEELNIGLHVPQDAELRTPQVEALTSRPGADPIAPVPRRLQILHTGDQRQIGLNEQRILGIKRVVLGLLDPSEERRVRKEGVRTGGYRW